MTAEMSSEEADRNRRRDEERERPGVRPPAAAGERPDEAAAYQPDTVHISLFSRAASAPAAARKSSPESRKA